MPVSTDTRFTVAECHAQLRRLNNQLRRAKIAEQIEALWREADQWLDRMLEAMAT